MNTTTKTGNAIEQARAYAASLSTLERVRWARNIILNSTRWERECTESHLWARCDGSGLEPIDYETAVGELLDEGRIRSTIMDARAKCALDRDFGFIPCLVYVR
jgi:hypothetical protein